MTQEVNLLESFVGMEDDCAVERKLYGKNAGVKLLEALYPDGISERSDGFCRRM